jgi:hypothetical protein
MKRGWFGIAGIGSIAVLIGIGLLGASPPEVGKNKLLVHEWGTFLSVQGSDGVALGGMVESEERLPRFVVSRGPDGWERTQTRMRAVTFNKMETPVTYFYTDRPMHVRVRVAMPRGLLTHWYPTVREMTPAWKKGEKLDERIGSALDWGVFELAPESQAAATQPRPALPAVADDDNWRFVRDTDSALVRAITGDEKRPYEYEKFLFYRGLGTVDFPPRAQTSGPDHELQLKLTNPSMQTMTGLFAIWVEGRTIRWTALPDLDGGAVSHHHRLLAAASPRPLAEGVPLAKAEVAEALIRGGLYRKEALAMVNNWEHSYFTTPGLRLLYLVPRAQVDNVIPIHIDPKPAELVRVMVGRIELLTPQREQKLARALGNLGAPDQAARGQAEAELRSLGRLREPVLRRLAALAQTDADRERLERLLAAGDAK